MNHTPFDSAQHISKRADTWKKVSALFTTIWALCIAISSFGIENMNHESIIYKNEAVNQWNYFQAKSIREKLSEIQSENLSYTNQSDPHYDAKINNSAFYEKESKRYSQEKTDIQANALKANKKSEEYDQKGNTFELAQVFFEIAIVLNAIFLLIDKSYVFYLSTLSGITGIILIITAII